VSSPLRRAALAVFLSIPAAAASAELPTETYALDDALLMATRNSAALQSAEQDITIAQQRVKEAVSLFYPDVGLQASATRFEARYPFALRPEFGSNILYPSARKEFYSGQGYLTLSLYEGRRHINTLRLARASLKQAQSKFEAAKLDIIVETKRAFYRLILAQELLAATEAVAGRLEEIADRSDAAQTLEAESLAADLRAASADARHRLEQSRLDFLMRLNRELDTAVRVEGRLETEPLDVDLRKLVVWATELRPELQSETYRAQMDAISVNLALGRRTPSILLGVDYGVVDSEFPLRQNNWDASVAVRIPFSFGFWPQHRQKLAEQRQGEIKRAELRDQVHLEVRKAHQDLRYWQGEWTRREGELRRMQELFQKLQSNGIASLAGLRAATRVLAANKRCLEARQEHILARAQLERAVGSARPLNGEP